MNIWSKNLLFYITTQIYIFQLDENVLHTGSKRTNSLRETTTWTFDARDHVVHLKTEWNLCARHPDVKRPLESGNFSR